MTTRHMKKHISHKCTNLVAIVQGAEFQKDPTNDLAKEKFQRLSRNQKIGKYVVLKRTNLKTNALDLDRILYCG